MSAGYLSTLEVAQLTSLLPEVATALIQRGCESSKIQGSSGLGECSEAAAP